MFRVYKFKRDEKGQAMVEFALVFLILVMLVLGIVQFSMIFSGQIAVTNAAREGARAATIGTDWGEQTDAAGEDTIYGIVKRAIGGHGYLDISGISVNVIGNTLGQAVTVVVDNVIVETIVPIPSFDNFGPGSSNIINANTPFRLDGRASMRLESSSGVYAEPGPGGGTGDDGVQEWSSSETYDQDERVQHNGVTYESKRDGNATEPPSPSDWKVVN